MFTLATLALILACPPTTEGPAPEHFVATPDWYTSGTIPLEPAPRSTPSGAELPVWNLDLAWIELDVPELATDPRQARDEDLDWLAWIVAKANAKPATAFAHLVAALSSDTLSAARLLWWRDQAPCGIDCRDALLAAWYAATLPETQTLLATALALALWEASCPATIEPDGACRSAGQLAVRSPITREEAERWTARAQQQRRATPASSVAARSLDTQLELAAAIPNYEALLATRVPEIIDFTVEYWRHDSGVPEWERIYERQVERASESEDQVGALFHSFASCERGQTELYRSALRVDVELAAIALLRQARIFLARDGLLGQGYGPLSRQWERERAESGEGFRYVHDQDHAQLDHARRVLSECVGLGQHLANETLDACWDLLSELDPDEHPPAAELVSPGPSRSWLEPIGVVSPEILDSQQSALRGGPPQ